MTIENRRAAVAAYKERKAEAGIYAVRCTASAEVWAGRAPDLSTIWNRLSFQLRHGGCTNRSLQAAWNAHRPEAFSFEAVERIDEEPSAYLRDRLLKERLAHWCARLGAERIS